MPAPKYTFEELMDSFEGLSTVQLHTLNSAIVETIRMRRRNEGRKVAATLQVGDTVKIADTAKPKYLAGKVATVTAFKNTRIEIQLPKGSYMGKFARSGGKLLCPPSMLTKEN